MITTTAQRAADILNGFNPRPKDEMAIRRRKVNGVYQYGIMRLLDGPLFLFDDGIAYLPSEAQINSALALCEKWNNELAANRK